MWSALYSTVVFSPFVSALAVASFLSLGDLPDSDDRGSPTPTGEREHERVGPQPAGEDGGSDERLVFSLSDLAGLSIDLHAGDLEIRGTDTDRIEVDIRRQRVGDRCQVKVVEDGGTLRIEAVLRPGIGGNRCEVDVDVSAPAALPVEADVGAGDIRLRDAGSSLDLETGAGDIRGTASSPRLEVSTGVGDIDLRQLMAAIAASTGTGTVSLSFDVAPDGAVDASTGLGDVRIRLPEATPVDATTSTGLGSVRQELPQQDGASTVVRASTGLGDVVLRSE